MVAHSKYYRPHETLGKYSTFKDNVDHINTHNAKGKSYQLGCTTLPPPALLKLMFVFALQPSTSSPT
jgi:hypothetical protein